jgi:hypothetical protein
VNGKFGFIYKPVEAFRFGTTITTPTYNWMTQQYSSDLSVMYENDTNKGFYSTLGTQEFSTVDRSFKFFYTTPLRLATGIAVFVGKSGFISADVEYVPYNLSSLGGRTNQDEKYFKAYNKLITNSYKDVVNLKIGGEMRLDIVKLRAGLAYLPNPYKYSDAVNRDIMQFSGGIGVRVEDIYFDLGIVNSRFESSYKPYSLRSGEATSSAKTKNSLMNVAFTIGFFFE